ncbi:hypothetical protein NE172_05035 [Clostridium botulinum]|uniref:Uncharacterized protein n=1 Tax=Clostridium botulinum TaxID=1491 RepID=A0A6B4JIW9_CLOBO|nr:hypothetical protein [Clostridium botulinum]EES49117.1 conserved hypothetical protein [Clostridium botulinum E1 str. 'BoNT E Beluga']MBY6760526.1 hypothetical protein [Clostridium botulinum]MBY6919433.1 hypothetical protein [Clostridium botulinum]MCR1130311.1 hypothetical protein [Clostridium botulinum]NFH69036.1 hypothetical protein [Clostridium botulinum]
MPNIILQDVNTVVHGTSRHGLDYDIAHVTMLIQTDEPISTDYEWAIPHIEDIPSKAIALLKDGKTPIYPMLKSKLRQDINSFSENVDTNNMTELLDDIEKALMLTCMHVTPLEPLENNNCRYLVSYKYRLYPVETDNFEFKVLLPFDGLGICNGGKLQLTLIAPIGATINPTITDAKDFNGQSVADETITQICNVNKNIVSFEIQQDPIFTIRYNY